MTSNRSKEAFGRIGGRARLEVASLWDGAPARVEERVVLTLEERDDTLVVDVEAPYHGDPAPNARRGSTWELWEHEVVEVFILGDDAHYTELELSPHGHHLALKLNGARNIVERHLSVHFTASVVGDRWLGRARLDGRHLPPGACKANAYAIHGVGDARRYLAAAPVPGPHPDFHRLESFQSVVFAFKV